MQRQSEKALWCYLSPGREAGGTLEPLTLWKGRETQHSINIHLRAQRQLHGGNPYSLTKGSPDSVLESGNPKHDG